MSRIPPTVGLLHPGAMGSELGALVPGPVVWAGQGRSPATHHRAELAGLHDVGSVDALVDQADIVLSVCPPAAAAEVAAQVARLGFGGTYVDGNAVAPDTARRIGDRFGPRFVDGALIGPPPTMAATTRFYLAGPNAEIVAGLFAGTRLEAVPLDGPPGSASALKMAYAGWTKGSAALLLAVRALAEAEGVVEALVGEWARSQPGLDDRVRRVADATGPKAWRFAGEMDEIADTLARHDLPDRFHRAAGDVYRRLAPLKGSEDPGLDQVLALLLPAPPPEPDDIN